MRPPIVMMSTQECCENLKQIRQQLHQLLQTTDDTESSPYGSTRHRLNSDGLIESLETARFHLGSVLDALGSEDPYRKLDNVWDSLGEVVVVEEADTATDSMNGDNTEIYMEMRQMLEGSIEDLKAIHWEMQTGLYEHWLYAHLETAVMQLSEARCRLGVLLTLTSKANEHTDAA